jgi:hypothetical protein
LQFANLGKPVSALAKPTSVLLSGSWATYDDAYITPSNSTQTPLPTLSTTDAANTAYHIPHSNLTVFIDASWQDCSDTGRSTVGYMIFHKNGTLIEANSTMPTPIAMSTSKADWIATCSLHLWPLPTFACYSMTWHTSEENNGVNLHNAFQQSHPSAWLITKPQYRLPAMEN